MKKSVIISESKEKFNNLPKEIQIEIDIHLIQGQYGRGANIKAFGSKLFSKTKEVTKKAHAGAKDEIRKQRKKIALNVLSDLGMSANVSQKQEELIINPAYDIVHDKYEEGGPVEEVGVNLFEDYENIPKNVQKILDKNEKAFMDGDYKGLAKAHSQLEKIGYTFEYYLDGQAYDLRKIGQKGKVELEIAEQDNK